MSKNNSLALSYMVALMSALGDRSYDRGVKQKNSLVIPKLSPEEKLSNAEEKRQRKAAKRLREQK